MWDQKWAANKKRGRGRAEVIILSPSPYRGDLFFRFIAEMRRKMERGGE